MKKLSVLIALAVALSVAACGTVKLPWEPGYPNVPTDAAAKKPAR